MAALRESMGLPAADHCNGSGTAFSTPVEPSERSDAFLVVLDFADRHNRVGAIGEIRGILQLIKPLFLFFVEFSGLEDMPTFIEEDHQRSRLRGQCKSLLLFRNGNVVELGS